MKKYNKIIKKSTYGFSRLFKESAVLILCLLLCIGTLSACGSSANADASLDAELIGTWGEDQYNSGYVFNEDGSGTDTFWDLSFTYTIPTAGTIHVVYDDDMWGETDYTYSIENGVLKLTLSSDGSTIAYNKK